MMTDDTIVTQELVRQGAALNIMVTECHGRSSRAGWYRDPKTGAELPLNVGEKLCLVHSEISEAMEGHRKNKQDDHLPHRKSIEVELADALIRICDLSGALGLDLGSAYIEKLLFNANRQDHKIENRAAAGGKAY